MQNAKCKMEEVGDDCTLATAVGPERQSGLVPGQRTTAANGFRIAGPRGRGVRLFSLN